MLIWKVFRAGEWEALDASEETLGARVDLAVGFIHFSTAAQLAETLRRHFAGAEGLVLAGVEADALGEALKWEPSRGGDLFPHLYRPLRRSDVVRVASLPLGPGGHVLPDLA